MSAEGLCGGLAAIMLITGCSPLPAVTPGREGDSETARSYRLDTVIEVEGREVKILKESEILAKIAN